MTVKSEKQIYKEDKCKLCDQMFKAKCGLNIHVGKYMVIQYWLKTRKGSFPMKKYITNLPNSSTVHE